MTAVPSPLPIRDRTIYPESDGKPVGETGQHVKNFRLAFDAIERFFADDPMVFIAGNMFLYFVQGDAKRNVCPDLFLVHGVQKLPDRRSYKTWLEGGNIPQVVIEFTSRTTRREDTVTKMALYQDTLKVREYFLFDPFAEYLKPPLQGYRLSRGRFLPIKAVKGRLPSRGLELQLERQAGALGEADVLRFWNPETERWLPTSEELALQGERAEEQRQRAEEQRQRAEDQLGAEREARRRAEAELAKAKRELEELRRGKAKH